MESFSVDEKENELFHIYNLDRHIENLTYNMQNHSDKNDPSLDYMKTEIRNLSFTLAELKTSFESKYNETLHLYALEH